MSDLKNLLNNRVVSPNINSSGYTRSYGIVIRAYEKDNCCDIQYFDARSRMQYKERVEVKINGRDDWFPSNGMLVEVEVFEERVIIINPMVSDYHTQMKPKSSVKNDIYADGADSSVGCYIF